jgi:NADH-quinone oxidoreductase subunit D
MCSSHTYLYVSVTNLFAPGLHRAVAPSHRGGSGGRGGLLGRVEQYASITLTHRLGGARSQGVAVSGPGGGVTGVLTRSGGFSWDLRSCSSYEVYGSGSGTSVYSGSGCSQSRSRVRTGELLSSAYILAQYGAAACGAGRASPDALRGACLVSGLSGMEGSIGSYSSSTALGSSSHGTHGAGGGSQVAGGAGGRGGATSSTEVPKGELISSLVAAAAGAALWRARVRCPDCLHIWACVALSLSCLLGDVVSLIGSIDIVFGSVDG